MLKTTFICLEVDESLKLRISAPQAEKLSPSFGLLLLLIGQPCPTKFLSIANSPPISSKRVFLQPRINPSIAFLAANRVPPTPEHRNSLRRRAAM